MKTIIVLICGLFIAQEAYCAPYGRIGAIRSGGKDGCFFIEVFVFDDNGTPGSTADDVLLGRGFIATGGCFSISNKPEDIVNHGRGGYPSEKLIPAMSNNGVAPGLYKLLQPDNRELASAMIEVK